jgi:hypothetical protein
VNEHATRVKVIKEEGFDLSRAAQDKFEKALHIYYDDLVETLVESLQRALSRAEKLPKTDRPLPIVLSGGHGQAERLQGTVRRRRSSNRKLPIDDLRLCRMASEPLTAHGARRAHRAMYEK